MAKVASPNAMILAERQRQLQPLDFAPSTVLTRDLPRDTVLKHLLLTLSGSIQTTYASGTPLADAQSTFDNLVDNINVTVNGSRIVKSVRPHLLAMQQLLAYKVDNDRRASAGAAQVVNPTIQGGFIFGTTGQYTTIYESLLVPFENIMATHGSETTWLNLKGVSSAEIRIATKGFTSLLCFGNTAPAFQGSVVHNLRISIATIEAQDVDSGKVFADWKQTTKQVLIAGQTTGSLVDLNRGNLLQSLMLFCKDGAAGAATTATGDVATNNLLADLKLKLNGQQDVKASSFLQIQSENRQRFGLVAPFSGNVSRLDGIAYFDFLRSGDLSTAIDCRAPLVDSVQLEVNSRGGSEFTYNAAKPASVTIMTNEIVLPA